jgi:hypothetical protein
LNKILCGLFFLRVNWITPLSYCKITQTTQKYKNMIETPSIFKQILQNPLLILKSPISMGNLGTKRVSIISFKLLGYLSSLGTKGVIVIYPSFN